MVGPEPSAESKQSVDEGEDEIVGAEDPEEVCAVRIRDKRREERAGRADRPHRWKTLRWREVRNARSRAVYTVTVLSQEKHVPPGKAD